MASITRKNFFVGFSSIGTPNSRQLVDIALVKQDLLNHFNTRRGERVMMPTWGCGIWEYLFEPLEFVKDQIVYEAQQVIDADPRVQVQSISVQEKDHGIRVDMVLLFVPFDVVDTFSINFDRRSQEMI